MALELALVGSGGMGLRHAVAISNMTLNGFEGIRLDAVCDSDLDKARELAATVESKLGYRPRVFHSYKEVLRDSRIDAVDIVLPTWLHHTVAIDALAAEKHVLLEKPLAISLAASDEILDAASKSTKTVAVAENYRRIPSNRAFKALVDSQSFGKPQAMTMQYVLPEKETYAVGGKTVSSPAWYHDPQLGGSYHILEMGVHEIDLQQYWFGPIVSVCARSLAHDVDGSDGTSISERGTLATLTFASGFVSQIAFLTGSAKPHCRRLVAGDRGFAESTTRHAWEGELVRNNGTRESLASITSWYLENITTAERERFFPNGTYIPSAVSDPGEPTSYGVGSAIADFVRAIASGERPEIGPCEARSVIAVCDAIMRSIKSCAPVRIGDA